MIKRMLIVLAMIVPLTAIHALETIDIDLVELSDASERASSPGWLDHANTGARTVPDLDFHMVISPDQRWILFGDPVEGLDVETYKLYVLSVSDFKMRTVAAQVVDAVFSPDSRFLFVATGPNPIIFDLAKDVGTVLVNIESGLENYPVWVSEWSQDGTELVIYQQARFDELAEPRAWKVTLTDK
ncbi:hypothetical protein JXM67_14725 [candidate division WOR-3 bacterium]|nr:hypothetical protein [candidate division WOR-3 bacterium]